MGTTARTPPPLGSVCTLVQSNAGSVTVMGNERLLREYFEKHPEQWLRLLALKKEDSNG